MKILACVLGGLLLVGCASTPDPRAYAGMTCDQLADENSRAEDAITRNEAINWGKVGVSAAATGAVLAAVVPPAAILAPVAMAFYPSDTAPHRTDQAVIQMAGMVKGCDQVKVAVDSTLKRD